MPDRRQPDPLITDAATAVTGVIAPTLKLIQRHGMAAFVALVCLGAVLWFAVKRVDALELQLKANNDMLMQHVRATELSAYVSYLSCLQLTKLTGDLPQACTMPVPVSK